MRKIAGRRSETDLERLMERILSSIESRERDWITLGKLLDELDALVPEGNGPADLEHLRRRSRAAALAEHPPSQIGRDNSANGRRDRLLRLPDVIKRVGLKKSAIYDKIRRNEFPKPVAISKRARAWHASKIAQWIDDCSRESEEA